MNAPEESRSAVQPYPRPSIEGGTAPIDGKAPTPQKLSQEEIRKVRQLLRKREQKKKKENESL